MENSFRSNHNQVAVSAYTAETAINTAQALDLSLLVEQANIPQLDPQNEDNKDDATGKEEADTIYRLGKILNWPWDFTKAQPQHFALLYGYGLGSVASAAAGTGYEKTITPISGDLDVSRSNPSMTGAARLGKTIAKQRLYSLFVDSISAKFAKGQWVQISAQLKGTGKSDTSITEETVNAAKNAASLTLAANGVAGSTAAERLASIHQIRVELSAGIWTEVEFSAASGATPAVITITPPGATGDLVDYKILYAPTEAAWMSFPARVSQTPLRVSEVTFMIGGKWNGSALVGGREMGAEVNSVEHQFNNNGVIEFSFGADGAYGASYFREGRSQVLTLDREFRNYILQNWMDQDEYFAATILAEGDVYDSPHKYQVLMIFPRLSVLKAPISVNGKRLAEKGDLTVLEDDTYGSVIVKVKDLAQYYAA